MFAFSAAFRDFCSDSNKFFCSSDGNGSIAASVDAGGSEANSERT